MDGDTDPESTGTLAAIDGPKSAHPPSRCCCSVAPVTGDAQPEGVSAPGLTRSGSSISVMFLCDASAAGEGYVSALGANYVWIAVA